VWIGADAVTSLGDCLAKVGCYSAALTAAHYGIPFYVAADTSKFDPTTVMGAALHIREFPATDVLDRAIPENAEVRNPVFEVIPASLVSGYITEIGVMSPGSVFSVMQMGDAVESAKAGESGAA
jgi:methylthioribose-1-phosphate isomerase